MKKKSKFQVVVDSCLLPLAFAREFARRHNPFGHQNRSEFARRKWFGGIRKFAEVNPDLFIGSTPSLRGLERLKELGVNTVLNLRASLDYRESAESLGLRYYAIPLNGKRPPQDEQIAEFLRVIEEPGNSPVFFHCNRARNRTYMLLGLYRISHDGWEAEQAIAEINHFGWRTIPDSVTSFLEYFANGGLKKIRAMNV